MQKSFPAVPKIYLAFPLTNTKIAPSPRPAAIEKKSLRNPLSRENTWKLKKFSKQSKRMI